VEQFIEALLALVSANKLVDTLPVGYAFGAGMLARFPVNFHPLPHQDWRCPMAYTLADLDAMSSDYIGALPFEQRDRLLDLAIADGRRQATPMVSYRTGLYCDYFEEDLVRLLKLRAVRIICRGTTASGFDGRIVGETEAEQYRAAFRHLQTTLEAAGSGYHRVVSLVVFLTNMDHWPLLNDVYREFIASPPCRAVIGTTGLAQKPLAIEIVECIAYRVLP
jgi:2-iminobutanoate/2-iminopropanoate deaminase